ncbi:hypothetical protein BU23DRAFT_178753 [Bimuria novae-zelandiae CBS 107.79]|uniref:CENP-V/GFA domain-containing protein n=1 Tax=Bimuria novae-zelandiae CBS 107.79 TaxID=1447943 RepID=A0A6A5V476_9PLEO|nr:hypothetical protein BU23DRAFT_178753 [Bimuria novae-zelandiae CBS 107.79]
MTHSTLTSDAKLTCLCGSVSLPGTSLKDEKFPIPSSLCHCNPCRYTAGALVPAFADLTGPPPADIKAKLETYQFTEFCARYFCSTCGSHCFVEHPNKENEWFCTAGIIEPPPGVKDVVQLTGHTYVSDTGDGGVTSLFLPVTTNGEKEIYGAKYGTEKINTWELEELVQESRKKTLPGTHDTLTAKCHCGGVDLQIKRADYGNEPEGVKTFMSKDDPHKYFACFCSCRSCRLSMGFSMCAWMYVALSAVTATKTGKPVLFGVEALASGANEGLNLKHHQSRDDVWRSFCGGCGASVFYWTNQEYRMNVVDIAVGLLRAQSGSMAREWVRWADGEVSHDDEGTDQTQVECVKKHSRIV